MNKYAPPLEPAVFWWRVEGSRRSLGIDQWGNSYGSTIVVQCYAYRVHHFTPKGARLTDGRFVLHEGKKKFAHATQAEARESFIKRKDVQISILSAQIADAEKAKYMAQNMNDASEPNWR